MTFETSLLASGGHFVRTSQRPEGFIVLAFLMSVASGSCVGDLGWAWSISDGHLRGHRTGDRRRSGLFLFLLICGTAFTANAMSDALIEGPMGGIWSWTIDDVGHAATWPHQHSPEALLR